MSCLDLFVETMLSTTNDTDGSPQFALKIKTINSKKQPKHFLLFNTSLIDTLFCLSLRQNIFQNCLFHKKYFIKRLMILKKLKALLLIFCKHSV